MASLATVEHKNQEATIYVGNLDAACDDALLLELFTQVGRVSSVHMPKDKLTSTHNGYGFVEFVDVTDAEYAMQVMNMVKLLLTFYKRNTMHNLWLLKMRLLNREPFPDQKMNQEPK